MWFLSVCCLTSMAKCFFGEGCYGFRFQTGFPVHLFHLAESAFQHTVYLGVGGGRVAMADDLLEASSPLSPTMIEIHSTAFWTLISHRAQNKLIPASALFFCCQNLLVFYYLLQAVVTALHGRIVMLRKCIKSAKSTFFFFFVCNLQSQRPWSWARKEEVWTRQTPWAPSQIHAPGSNQWKWGKVWRRDTGIFFSGDSSKMEELGGRVLAKICEASVQIESVLWT